MIYLIEFLKGIVLAFGIIIGFLIPVAYILHKSNKADAPNPDELVEPFRAYLKDVKVSEGYEEIPIVEGIINELTAGRMPKLDGYTIDKDSSLIIKDANVGTSLKVKVDYTIKKK